ncbi:MAG: hypothetical protein NUV93_05645 [Firmicutes bacterium]|nr:hypothetical protein [Bacillota bacterium]
MVGGIRAHDIIAILGGVVSGALLCTWTADARLPALVRTALVFSSMKVTGDALRVILNREETYYLEDMLGDMAAYACLAVISSGASWLAQRYLGGIVEPVFPGAVAHALMTVMPGREEQKRAVRG